MSWLFSHCDFRRQTFVCGTPLEDSVPYIDSLTLLVRGYVTFGTDLITDRGVEHMSLENSFWNMSSKVSNNDNE